MKGKELSYIAKCIINYRYVNAVSARVARKINLRSFATSA